MCQVVDEGDALQIWRVAANVLNKQSWTAENGWSLSLGTGWGANNPHHKKPACYKCYTGPWT